MNRIIGLITPLLTPFANDGKVAEELFPPLLRFSKQYTSGYFVCGSFGSGMMMELSERKKALELIIQANDDPQKLIIAHVGTTSTVSTIELANHAQEHGAQMLAALVPYYYPHTDAEILFHFRSLLESTDLPVYLYDYPSYANRKIDLDLFERLIALGVQGVKDTTGSLDALRERIQHIPASQCDYVVGTESLFVPAYELGVRGCISGLSNAFPEIVAALVHSLEKGNNEDIELYQNKIKSVKALIKNYPKMAAFYAILAMHGIPCGRTRGPFGELSQSDYNSIHKVLSEMSFL